MGRGWGGVNVNEGWCLSGDSTPTHEQVRIAPRSEAMPGVHGNLLISPIKGEGSARLDGGDPFGGDLGHGWSWASLMMLVTMSSSAQGVEARELKTVPWSP